MNIINATELYTFKWLTQQILLYFTTFLNVKNGPAWVWITWLERHPTYQKVVGLILSGHISTLYVRSLVGAHMGGSQLMFLSLPIPLYKINKYISLGEDFLKSEKKWNRVCMSMSKQVFSHNQWNVIKSFMDERDIQKVRWTKILM